MNKETALNSSERERERPYVLNGAPNNNNIKRELVTFVEWIIIIKGVNEFGFGAPSLAIKYDHINDDNDDDDDR